MPTIRFASATNTDALSNLKFAVVPARGAILNLWVSGATASDVFGIALGNREIIVAGTECNIEIAVDVVDVARDQLVFDEVLQGGGQLFFPTVSTAEVQAILALRYL